jgi:hypothetical protein
MEPIYRMVSTRKINLVAALEDIVQPKKRGVKRGTIGTSLTSYTITDIF